MVTIPSVPTACSIAVSSRQQSMTLSCIPLRHFGSMCAAPGPRAPWLKNYPVPVWILQSQNRKQSVVTERHPRTMEIHNPFRPPLEKGGWGDLKCILYAIFHDGFVTPAYRPRSRPRAGQAGAKHENPSQSPFCLSLTGKRLQRGRLHLPFVKGGAAVQSLITHASEALGLWRRTVGRDLRKVFSR